MKKWNPFSYKYKEIAKAVWAFILPGVAVIAGAFVEGTPIDKGVLFVAVGAMFGIGGTVFAIPNKSTSGGSQSTPAT